MTQEYKNYKKKLRNEKLLIIFFQIFIATSFLFIWQILAHYNIINTFIYSSPKKIIETIIKLHLANNLYSHIIITVFETLVAFSLGLIFSFIISLILYEFKIFAKIIDPYLTILNSLPKIALGPLLIIIIGANTKSIIAMALFINLIIGITTIYTGFQSTDETKIKLFKSFKSSKLNILFKLVIPSSYRTIISSLKLNISMSLIGVIMGEFLVSKAGIGYLIIYGTQVFNLNLVYTGIFFLVIISIILYQLVYLIEKKLMKHIH